MRKLLLTVAGIIFLGGGIADAQTLPPKNNLVYGGVKYSTAVADGEKKLIIGGGYGWRVSGNLWQINNAEIGTTGYTAVEPLLAYTVFTAQGVVTAGGTLTAALLGGVSGDWIQWSDSTPYQAYLPGTVGAVVALEFANGAGFFVSGRQKFAFKENLYHNGFTFTLNLMKRF